MDHHAKWKRKWKLLLPTAAVLATVVLLFLIYPKLYDTKVAWGDDQFYTDENAEVDLEYGHGPVTHPSAEPNDFGIRLHPERHIHREPKKIALDWKISKGIRRPDGVAKSVYLINDQFPGPTIEMRSGDELLVNIENELQEDEGVAIHWHGLRIENAMDGVVGLTQCAISSGQKFTYRLKVPEDQAGSFWYHSHSELQRADGLFGALIVHKPFLDSSAVSELEEYGYEHEQVLMIGDWYHRPATDVLTDYTNWVNFKIEPAPDSMLLNGMGYFECSMATKARPVDCEAIQVPHLGLSGSTRVRIANTGALTGFSVSAAGYAMTLLQVDGGHEVEAVQSQLVGILYPGERIDVLFERYNNSDESGSITVSLDGENMRFPNLALTARQSFSIASAVENEPIQPHGDSTVRPRAEKLKSINLAKINGSRVAAGELAEHEDDIILLYATITYMTQFEYRPKGFINHTSWSLSGSVGSPLLAMEQSAWPDDPKPFVVKAGHNHWVDLVINNIDDKGHPFHVHGHDFYILSMHQASRVGAYEQYNPYEPETAMAPLDLINPVIKDTVYIPSQGYAVLRFKAENLGMWLVHCHVLWHEAVGMNMAIQVGDDRQVRGQPVMETIDSSCAG